MKTHLHRIQRLSLISAAFLLLAGCASSSAVVGRGNGLASGALYRTAESKVMAADAAAASACQTRSVANTEVVKPPAVVATPYNAGATFAMPDASKSVSGYPATQSVEVAYSEFVERWTLNRCGEQVRYLVTFRPDGTVLVAPEQ